MVQELDASRLKRGLDATNHVSTACDFGEPFASILPDRVDVEIRPRGEVGLLDCPRERAQL